MRQNLWSTADRIAIALSGGSDSVALTWLLHDLAQPGRVAVAGLIHVNHLLRGAESAADEAFCRALALRLGWPIEVARVDVAARARATSQSIEAAARDVRYEWFETAAATLGATVVVTGHTADDQAETVLMRLLRGAGTRGLSGIRARRGPYARPLLDSRRADLRAYLQARGEGFRDDASNQDPSIPRNRIRLELLPVIERLAPAGVRALARLASFAADDEAYLTGTAIERASGVVLSNARSKGGQGTPGAAAESMDLDARELAALPPALGRRLIRELAAQVAPGAALGAAHLQDVWALVLADKSAGHLDLPGLSVRRRGGVMTLAPGLKTRPPGDGLPGLETRPPLLLEVPGSVDVPEANATITAERRDAGAGLEMSGPEIVGTTGRSRAFLQAASFESPLSVRTRRPGDRLRPLGAPGRRKVQDLLVDRKVPRDERDRVPIVVDARGRLVWVAGVAMAEECRVTAPEAGMVILELRKQ